MAIVPTVLNGKYPEWTLAELPGYDGDGGPHIADGFAVRSYNRLRRDFIAAGLGDLLPTPGFSCYRTLSDQAYMRAHGLTTVPVGKSIHGEAKAVDFQGIPFGSARHNWLKANGGRYGWYQPQWAKQTGSLPESWHWEYDYYLDTEPTPPTPPVPPTPTPDPVPDLISGLEDDMRLAQKASTGEIVLVGVSTLFSLTYPEYVVMRGVIGKDFVALTDDEWNILHATIGKSIVNTGQNLRLEGF